MTKADDSKLGTACIVFLLQVAAARCQWLVAVVDSANNGAAAAGLAAADCATSGCFSSAKPA
jgi:hypothetical protein